MERVGELIKRIRVSSQYPSLRAFADEVGLSYEGLRKMEIGLIFPKDDVIWKISQLPGIPEFAVDHLLLIWEMERGALPRVPRRAKLSKAKLFGASRRVLSVFSLFLTDCQLKIKDADRKALLTRITQVLEEEIHDSARLFAQAPDEGIPE